MKALPVEKLPEGDCLYEIEFDGYRALDFKDGKAVRMVSCNKKAFDYPHLIDALKGLPAEQVVLDGEIAAPRERTAFVLHCNTFLTFCCIFVTEISCFMS
jgi:ATP-dependent DNA ligase